ncbi:MAG: SDR family NAD(P)-dependent oxidoreductase [Anaerolineales bacterium]
MRKGVLITGAAGGLGKAFAVDWARRGWDLFLTDLDRGRLALLAEGLQRTYGVAVRYQASDLMDPFSRADLFRTLQDKDLRFQGLINVAGLDVEGVFKERTREELRGIIRLNVEGTLEVTHMTLDLIDPMQPFWIITVSSLAAFFPIPVKATYAASKRFLLDFSMALRDEIRTRVATVTVLCPAGLPTTPEAVAGIEAQGWIGQLTTRNVGFVARLTIDSALKGRRIVIPGWINRFLRWGGGLLPAVALSGLLGKRWRTARQNRSDLSQDEPELSKAAFHGGG